MSFCVNCGAEVADNVKFCPSCGEAVMASAAAQTRQPAYQQAAQQDRQSAPVYQQAAQQDRQSEPVYQPPVVPGAPTQSDIRDAQENKTMAVLAYLLFFIPLLTGAHKTSPFAKYHTNQGTVLFLLCLAWGVVYSILLAIFTAMLFNPRTWLSGGWGALGAVTTILGILWLIPTALCIVGIVNAATGKMRPLPVIGRFTVVK